MNCYMVLLLLCFMGLSEAGGLGRAASAKKNYLEFLQRYKMFKEGKDAKDHNEPQTRLHRNAWRDGWRERQMNVLVNRGIETTTTTTTTTTKSPLQILRDRKMKLKIQNPKGINPEGFDKMKKEIEALQKKYSLKKCKTNEDCNNGSCCMLVNDGTEGTCQKPPHRLNQQCSDFCPCKTKHNLECKMSETTKNGHNDYTKKCLPKAVPESTNLDLIKIFKNAKRQHMRDRSRHKKEKKLQAKQAA